MASSKLRLLFPVALSLTPLLACGGAETEVERAADGVVLGQAEQAITIGTDGRRFMAPYEADAQELLQEIAVQPERWTQIMNLVYGKHHDAARAEELRAKIERGDFSWTPPVQLVNKGALGNAWGAYAAAKNLVFLDESVPEGAVRSVIYLEEIGHYLDARLNRKDSKGDEGQFFRRMVLGDQPSEAEIEALRADVDTGTFVWNGQRLDVEHFSFPSLPCLILGCGGSNPIPVLPPKYLYPKLQTIGDYLAMATRLPYAGASIMQGWVSHGLGDVAGRIVNVTIPANPLVVIQNLNAMKNAVFGVVKNVADAPQLFQRGIERISAGNYLEGITDVLISMSIVSGAYSSNPDFIFNLGQETLSDLQTKLGLEPSGRPLSSTERAALESVFKGGLLYNGILIKEGFAGLYSINDRPLTLQNTIYLKDEKDADTLVHEATHVWQFQHFGTRYKLEAVLGQAGDGYEWGIGFDQGKSFDQLNPEQQATLIEDGYRNTIQQGHYPKARPNHRQVSEPLALPYFVKGWHTVSDRAWENKVLQVFGSARQYWVNATSVCELTAGQYDLLGAPAITTVPQAWSFRGWWNGGALAACNDLALGPAPSLVSAFAWSHSPTGSVDAIADYSFSSTNGSIKISNLSTGRYEVSFGNSSSSVGGNVQVTAYGSDSARCKVAGWRASGADELVDVRCFDPAGAAVNTLFSVGFHARTGLVGPGQGYVWANDPTSPSYTPDLFYQWNSKPGNATIQRNGVGSYSVSFPNQSFSGGTVLVTAYGTGSEHCKVNGWGGSNVGVACFDTAGAPVDASFALDVNGSMPLSTRSASFVWANDPWSASYTPSSSYQRGEVAGLGVVPTPATIQRWDTGKYTVSFPSMGGAGVKSNVQVTAYGGGSESCKVLGWNNSAPDNGASANVACHTAAGAPVDTLFTATYSTNRWVIP